MMTNSGMAAFSTMVFTLLEAGDHSIFCSDIYGGVHAFAMKEFPRSYLLIPTKQSRHGIHYTFVNSVDPADFEKEIKSNTKMIYIESPTNPLMTIVDIRSFGELGRKHNIPTIIDNTFASPINQKPISLGINLVYHRQVSFHQFAHFPSGTKYLNGHSDIVCGVLAGDASLIKRIHQMSKKIGGILNPFDCFLLERG